MLHDLEQQRGLSFCVAGEVVQQRFGVLLRNGFIQGETDVCTGSTTSVRMQHFDPMDVAGFESYVANYLLQQPDLGTACTEDEQGKIVAHLLEIFTNVKRHANTDQPVFVCGQYYPKTQQLKFTLVDLGQGYLKPIQEFTRQTPSPVVLPENALRWALTGHNSSLPRRNGGFGLKMLRNYCIGRGGELHLCSDGYYLTGKRDAAGRVTYSAVAVPPFQGSVVHAIFNCGQASC
ncbi:hypothetical protein [Hymenobacter weizhouensis]|uniref:hypothetical protein n=1 Tax=Hymenobacter sp. YIM 151500-1 TaxID=2987689 RepID=UPI0022261B1B|nr:hypothetical protein [Hymenobacter sp. YIM 151500-1]UYZ64923.1 hypothetical protein OIS53_08735 [Hymenobacter sp. YIM 151500-1]